MEKKHISIIGACSSRNLFNNKLIGEIFEVDRYAYHICPWDLFNEPLNVPLNDINKFIKEEFTARMINYDVNKITIKELENYNSEYLLLDFYTFAAAPIQKITYNGKYCYSQNTCFRYYNFEHSKDSILSIEIVNKAELEKDIKEGLQKFAVWIKEHYDLSKVVVFVPTFADKYVDLNNTICKYENHENSKKLLDYIKKVSLDFVKLLDNKAKILDLSGMDVIAQFGIYDDPTKLKIPPVMHLTESNYIEQSKKFLELINVSYKTEDANNLIKEKTNVNNAQLSTITKVEPQVKDIKKHISIIGSCVSRNLFNTSVLSDIFDVDNYIFQRCVWDRNASFNISKEFFDKIPTEEFNARMLEYSMNKSFYKLLETKKSEYLLIDLHNLIAPVFEVKYKNNICYFQNTSGADKNSFEKAKDIQPFDQISCNKLESIDDSVIYEGLTTFANWVKVHYQENKVIIYVSKFAKKYYKNNIILTFSNERQLYDSHLDSIVEKFSLYLKSLIPNSIYMPDVGNKIATYGLYDNLDQLFVPPAEHYTVGDQIKQAELMLSLLDLGKKNSDYYYFDSLSLQSQLTDLTFKYNKNKVYLTTLNNYFDKIENLKDVIVVITSFDEASLNLKYFRNKNKLGIKTNFKFRDSYIAIVDKSRDFVYENSSQDKIMYNYCFDDKFIHVTSAGFTAGNVSVVKVGDSDVNLSPQKRGLNIVLLNSKTLEVVDQAYCDTFGDKELKVTSKYLENIKIKI